MMPIDIFLDPLAGSLSTAQGLVSQSGDCTDSSHTHMNFDHITTGFPPPSEYPENNSVSCFPGQGVCDGG